MTPRYPKHPWRSRSYSSRCSTKGCQHYACKGSDKCFACLGIPLQVPITQKDSLFGKK